jgi:predicted tellurium resistance membrane protein TerC
MDWLADPATWIAFLTLVALELVLGVDNVIFISILAGKLPANEQKRARSTGIMLAVVTRILLLLSLSWIIGLTEPLFSVLSFEISGRDLVLMKYPDATWSSSQAGFSCFGKAFMRSIKNWKARKDSPLPKSVLRSGASSFRSCCWILSSRSIR